MTENVDSVSQIIEALRREQGLLIEAVKGQIVDLRDTIQKRFEDFKAAVHKDFAAIDKRFDGVTNLIYILTGLFVTGLLGGGIPLLVEVSGIKQEVKDYGERLALIEKRNTAFSDTQKQTFALLQQVAGKVNSLSVSQAPTPSPYVALSLDDEQRQIIRKYIPVEKKGGPGFPIKLGAPAPEEAALEPMPVELVAAVPVLKGFRYIADYATGVIAIVNPVNIVAAVI